MRLSELRFRQQQRRDLPLLYDCQECKALVSENHLTHPDRCPYCGGELREEKE